MNETVCGYEVHPACAMLPMMNMASLREMADDIAAHGQQQPVVVYQGLLLDGRNRLKACELAGVQPDVREWVGDDPVRWVLSLNFHRRHLTDSQKSIVGARAADLLAQRVTSGVSTDDSPVVESAPAEHPREAAPKPPSAREIRRQAQETAAALVNTSPKAIARGRRLIDNAVPELVGAVARGAVTLTQAARVAKLDESFQRDLVAKGDDAIVEEATRIQKDKGAQRPSLTRALADLDLLCETLSIEKSAIANWQLRGALHAGQALTHEGATLKEVVVNAWAQAQAALDQGGVTSPDRVGALEVVQASTDR